MFVPKYILQLPLTFRVLSYIMLERYLEPPTYCTKRTYFFINIYVTSSPYISSPKLLFSRTVLESIEKFPLNTLITVFI